MRKLTALWHRAFDVRPGEYLRTLFMSLYLLFVLFAYYILKPVSRSMFLNQFDIDKLPVLYILIAGVGGLLAYLYTKLAVSASLAHAVNWAMGIAVACLLGFWWMAQYKAPWLYFVFNIWVSLFSIVLVSQGWLVAANIFDPREAKRLYGLLGLGAVLGAAFGGVFTSITVHLIGTRNLMLASAAMVLLAYAAFRGAAAVRGEAITRARAADREEAEFSFRDILSAVGRHRHLQMILSILTITYIVDVMVEFQFNVMAKQAYSGNHLTAFLGAFYGLYLNLVTFILQFFLTALVVNRVGVGGMLQIMPVAIGTASLFTFASPGVHTTAGVRLTEAATRYSLNRTGMELLYLPLPAELKNRTKAFVDIFVDRMGRGFGGMLLLALTSWLALGVRQIALICFFISLGWILLSVRASREYVATVKHRLAERRLTLEDARLTVTDPSTVALLEQTAETGTPRQAVFALSLLAEAPGYRLWPRLERMAASAEPAVRAKVFELARGTKNPGLLDRALEEVRGFRGNGGAVGPAVEYALSASPGAPALLREFLRHPEPGVAEAAIAAAGRGDGGVREALSPEWIADASRSPDWHYRRLAAMAVGVTGDQNTEALQRLLDDGAPEVAAAACRSAGSTGDRAYVDALVKRLGDSRVRRDAIEALASFGARICGTLADVLEDESVPAPVRQQVPRVLRLIPDQRSVDVLIRSIGQPDLPLREAVLKALNRLRESAPNLNYGGEPVNNAIFDEARRYYQLAAALAPLRGDGEKRGAVALLASSIDERLRQTLARLFRLLGLRYPPKEIYLAYLAVNHRREAQSGAAIEFLDNILERPFKRVLLPLLDAPADAIDRGRDLFGIEPRDAETAIAELIRSGDPWLAACAIAAAAELRMGQLAGLIAEGLQGAGAEIRAVAQRALEQLRAGAGEVSWRS